MSNIFCCLLLIVLTFNQSFHAQESHQLNYDQASQHGFSKKQWTFIIYMAADNDLRGFAVRNIKQMAAIGSNEFFNILVHLDIKISGNRKITRRYYIEKNKILHVNADDPYSQMMDSGDPQTLISCCSWAIKNYPAHDYALIFWNHATGPLDPASGRIINPTQFFTLNPNNNRLELDRSISFFDVITETDQCSRGVCWDDSTGNYLTNQKLDEALNIICSTLLDNNKFSIVGFDACLMSSIEIANIVKKYAKIMVGSQEVELGTGWNYQRALSLFQQEAATPQGIAEHIVKMFGITYNSITDDYTQSAVDLNLINELEGKIHAIAGLLVHALKQQKNNSVKNMLRISRNKESCTYFEEPSYLDMHHLFSNIQNNLPTISMAHQHEEVAVKNELFKLLEEGKDLIKKAIIANSTGKNLRLAQGLSIYFPENKLHHSYRKTTFAQNNAWFSFLTNYLT